jgi:hypothetical protein
VVYAPPTWLAVWGHDHKGDWRFSLRSCGGDEAELYSAATAMPATDERPPGTTLIRHLGLASAPGSQWQWDCERSRWTRHVFPITPAAERAILDGDVKTR